MNEKPIQLKQVRVLLKTYADDMTYSYHTKTFRTDRTTTKKELKQLQKQLAARYGVKMNMVAATIEEIN